MTHNQTHAQRLESAETTGKVLDLRKGGASYSQIAAEMTKNGHKLSRQRCHIIVQNALKELREKLSVEAADVRTLELERLDAMWLALYPKRKEPRVADSLVRLMDRRAKLLGLDAPKRIEQTGRDGGPIEYDLSGLSVEELRALLMVLDKATPVIPADDDDDDDEGEEGNDAPTG